MIQIRYANYEDYKLVLDIDSSISKEKWESWTKSKQAVLAFDNGSLAGWLQYGYFIEKIPFVNRLYLFEKYQRCGLGTGLMKFWECEMAEKGYSCLMLSTEKENTAQIFYKKLGYRVLGGFDYFGSHNEILLGKEVKIGQNCCCTYKQK